MGPGRLPGGMFEQEHEAGNDRLEIFTMSESTEEMTDPTQAEESVPATKRGVGDRGRRADA